VVVKVEVVIVVCGCGSRCIISVHGGCES